MFGIDFHGRAKDRDIWIIQILDLITIMVVCVIRSFVPYLGLLGFVPLLTHIWQTPKKGKDAESMDDEQVCR